MAGRSAGTPPILSSSTVARLLEKVDHCRATRGETQIERQKKMTEELKACPFCGQHAKYEYGEDWYEITCLCGYSFQHSDRCYPGESMADAMIRSWNTRPIEDELLEALEEAPDGHTDACLRFVGGKCTCWQGKRNRAIAKATGE
jgi:hypothetical protein